MRGEILNVDRKQQIIDFSGLRFGQITPTDLDGLIEYKDNAYIFYEFKYLDAQLPYGQRLAMERLVRDIQSSGKKAVAAICQHDIHDTSKAIPGAECAVREFYSRPQNGWSIPKKPYTVREFTDMFFDWAKKSDVLGA